MPFHFATLAKDTDLFHTVISSESCDDARGKITQLPPPFNEAAVRCVHRIRDSLNDLFSRLRDHPSDAIPLDIHGMQRLQESFEAQGAEMIDADAAALAPFVSARTFANDAPLEDDKVSLAFPKNRIKGAFQPVDVLGMAVKRISYGMKKRIEDTRDYSFYFVSGQMVSGKWADLLVDAQNEKEFKNAFRAKKHHHTKAKVIHRLSPRLQSVFDKAAYPDAVIHCTRTFLREIAEHARREGRGIYESHRQEYLDADNGKGKHPLAGDYEAFADMEACIAEPGMVTLKGERMKTLLTRLIGQGKKERAEELS